MKTTKVIGFAGTFYTLWSLSSEKVYYTAPNGNHYPSYMVFHYSYIKNVSTDIEKVKTLYPDIAIDDGLKGKTRSFSYENKEKDLTPEILKFGKYAGWNINDLAKHDFNYLAKMIDEFWGSFETRNIAKETPEYIAFLTKAQEKLNHKIASFRPLENGKHKITIERNPDEQGVVYVPIVDGQTLELHFKDVKGCYYNGMTYYLPVLSNGKAKRLKGKEFEYDLEIIETNINTEHGYCYQIANVLN